MISLNPPPDLEAGTASAPGTSRWLALQHSIDFPVTHPPDALLACDVVALYSEWWGAWIQTYFESRGFVPDRVAFSAALAARTAVTGFSALEAWWKP